MFKMFSKPAEYERSSNGGWQSKRLNGALGINCGSQKLAFDIRAEPV
ncbi:MAG: hypothetical protein PHH28_08470 [Desulfuromonadaceae bacterium]|nr:hypothetical protein [Desulfuromonadaceae bacterium]